LRSRPRRRGLKLDRLLARWLRAARGATPGQVPLLDLHGFGVRDALALTERFLADAVAAGEREVRIVYGKGRHSPGGRGVLREVIPRWLEHEGRRWVESASPEPDAFGEDAAMRIRLRRGAGLTD
jgi:DNA-nicking Smr family endonuclease